MGFSNSPARSAANFKHYSLFTIHYSLFTIHFPSVQVVNRVDEFAEAGVIAALEGEFEAGEEAEAGIRVSGVGIKLPEVFEWHDIRKILYEPREGCLSHGVRKTNGEGIALEVIGVIAAVEGRNVVVGIFGVLGDVEELHILRRDKPGLQKFFLDEVNPAVPVGFAGRVHEHHRENGALAGLDEGDGLKNLIHGTETTGESNQGIALLEEVELAASIVSDMAHPDATIIWGSQLDESLEDTIRVTVVATGLGDDRKNDKKDDSLANIIGNVGGDDDEALEDVISFFRRD